MAELVELIGGFLIVTGTVFCIIGGIGLHRLPDLYTRMHAAGITDSLGAGLVLFGLMLYGGLTLVTVKLITVLVFLWLTSPTSTHALAKAAYFGGLPVRAHVITRQSRLPKATSGGDRRQS